MKALQLYAKYLIRLIAYEEICADIKKQALRELQKMQDGKSILEGVEFHLTNKVTTKYRKDIADILKDLTEQINQQKKLAKESGKYNETITPTFDASIPKSTKKLILSGVMDYAKHFGLK